MSDNTISLLKQIADNTVLNSNPTAVNVSFTTVNVSGSIPAGKLSISIICRQGSGTIIDTAVQSGQGIELPPIPGRSYTEISYTVAPNSEFLILVIG